MSAGHLHSFSSAFTVAKREKQSQEWDAACSPVQPEFWMRSLTFAMPVALWPHSTLQGFWEEEAMQRSSEACCFLAALTDVWQCALLWQQPAAMLSLAKTIGSRWLCPILPWNSFKLKKIEYCTWSWFLRRKWDSLHSDFISCGFHKCWWDYHIALFPQPITMVMQNWEKFSCVFWWYQKHIFYVFCSS